MYSNYTYTPSFVHILEPRNSYVLWGGGPTICICTYARRYAGTTLTCITPLYVPPGS